MLRVLCALAFFLIAAGCSSDGDEPGAAGSSRVEKCVARFLERAEGGDTAEVEHYARSAYCEPFDRRSWVHEDGTLKIDAYRKSGSCVEARPGEPAQTVLCDEADDGTLDCGVLNLIRRAEVQRFLAERQRKGEVRCDDGTPLEELGAQ